MDNKILRFIKENYAWVTAVFTGLSVVLSFLLKFMKYLFSYFYFFYYGLSYEFINENDVSFIYNFGLGVLFAACFLSLIFCYLQLFGMLKNKLTLKTIIINICIIFFSNVIIISSLNISFFSIQFLLNMIVLIVFEILISFRFRKKFKKKVDHKCDKEISLVDYLKIFPFYLLLMIFLFLFIYSLEIIPNKTYRIINDDKVIIYVTKDYYLLLDCEIIDTKLVIYKGNQTKINNNNIKDKTFSFDVVELK